MCLSHGVQGDALPGSDYCAAHGGTPGLAATAEPVRENNTDMDDGTTGLTQAIDGLQMERTTGPPPGLQRRGLELPAIQRGLEDFMLLFTDNLQARLAPQTS